MASNQPIFTTGVPVQTSSPVIVPMNNAYGMNQMSTGFLDKPADKRLLPWVLLGSLVLAAISAGMIVTTFTSFGILGHLWGIFIAGCALGVAALFGFLAAITRRSAIAALWFAVMTLAWIGAVAVMIVNAILLHHYINKQCGSTLGCRQYYVGMYTAWGALVAAWVPVMVLISGYFWRTTRLHRTANGNANNVNAASGLPANSNKRFGLFKKQGNYVNNVAPVGYAGR